MKLSSVYSSLLLATGAFAEMYTKSFTVTGSDTTYVSAVTKSAHDNAYRDSSVTSGEMYTKSFTVTGSDTTYVSAVTKSAHDYAEETSETSGEMYTKTFTVTGSSTTYLSTVTKSAHDNLEQTSSTASASSSSSDESNNAIQIGGSWTVLGAPLIALLL